MQQHYDVWHFPLNVRRLKYNNFKLINWITIKTISGRPIILWLCVCMITTPFSGKQGRRGLQITAVCVEGEGGLAWACAVAGMCNQSGSSGRIVFLHFPISVLTHAARRAAVDLTNDLFFYSATKIWFQTYRATIFQRPAVDTVHCYGPSFLSFYCHVVQQVEIFAKNQCARR